MTMNEAMQAEQAEAIASLQKANDLLFKMFGLSPEEDVETDNCTRCEQEVESDTLVSYGDWKLCEICQGDI